MDIKYIVFAILSYESFLRKDNDWHVYEKAKNIIRQNLNVYYCNKEMIDAITEYLNV